MTAAALLAALRERGVTLTAVGTRLEYDGPAAVLTPEVLDRLRRHKAALRALLSPDAPEPVPWHGQTLFAWPGADLLYAKGEEPRWCGGCGVELAARRHALCPACRKETRR